MPVKRTRPVPAVDDARVGLPQCPLCRGSGLSSDACEHGACSCSSKTGCPACSACYGRRCLTRLETAQTFARTFDLSYAAGSSDPDDGGRFIATGRRDRSGDLVYLPRRMATLKHHTAFFGWCAALISVDVVTLSIVGKNMAECSLGGREGRAADLSWASMLATMSGRKED